MENISIMDTFFLLLKKRSQVQVRAYLLFQYYIASHDTFPEELLSWVLGPVFISKNPGSLSSC